MKFLSSASAEELKGTAILRLDFNTEDSWRMEVSIPTIDLLAEKADKIVILSHKGRPRGADPALSLKKDAEKLQRLLNKEIKLLMSFDFEGIYKEIAGAPSGSIFMLENLRFLPEEQANEPALAEKLASLGDFYVNDAFSVSHRENASVVSLPRSLPSFAGLEFESEINNLSKVREIPEPPFVFVLGGGKPDEKLEMVKFMYGKMSSALLAGVPGNTLLKAKGENVGASKTAKDPIFFREYLSMSKIIIPEDWVENNGMILDIGPNTIENFKYHLKGAKTVVWNGPLGFIEDERFINGSLEIAREIIKSGAFSVVGGGETIMFLKKFGLDKQMKFISTGGGAMLDFLAGKELPGIKALD